MRELQGIRRSVGNSPLLPIFGGSDDQDGWTLMTTARPDGSGRPAVARPVSDVAGVPDTARLRNAIQDSQYIGAATGLLMSLHEISEPQALDLLRLASRLRHRRLADFAHEVLIAGCLDPF